MDLVARCADPGNELPFPKNRSDCRDIWLMDGAEIRVVANENIAILDHFAGAKRFNRAVNNERQHVALRNDVGPNRHKRPVSQHYGRGGVVSGD